MDLIFLSEKYTIDVNCRRGNFYKGRIYSCDVMNSNDIMQKFYLFLQLCSLAVLGRQSLGT